MSYFSGDSNFDRLSGVETRDPPAHHGTNIIDNETVDIFGREDCLRIKEKVNVYFLLDLVSKSQSDAL
jgi:hypothetical protein